MDHPYENTMLLPANYAVIPEDEMTYLGGGEEIILARIGNTYLTLDTEQAAQFCMNVVVNFGYLLTNASFNYISNLYQSGKTNGLSLAGTIYHTWGKLATPAGEAAPQPGDCCGGDRRRGPGRHLGRSQGLQHLQQPEEHLRRYLQPHAGLQRR